MIRKLFLSSFVFVVLLSCSFPVSGETSASMWSQPYGRVSEDRNYLPFVRMPVSDTAYSVVESPDGGYAVAGFTADLYSYSAFWLVKTDEFGTVEWNKTYSEKEMGEHELPIDCYCSLVATSDGGYALSGYMWSSSRLWDCWLIKTDSAGNVEWSRTYGGTEDDFAQDLIVTSDGGFAIAGTTNSSGAGEYDFWLIKTDENGNMEWNQTYGGEYGDIVHSLIETSDEGYALAGYTWCFGSGWWDFWLVKTDKFGNMEWHKAYGGEHYEQAYSVVEASDGGYALAGYTDSFPFGTRNCWLVKTNELGDMKWNKTYGGTEWDSAYSLLATSDRGYVIAGSTHSFGAGGEDFYLVKTDEFGNEKWYKTYGGTECDMAYSLITTSDGGYAIAGCTYSLGDFAPDFYVVKTDEYGICAEFQFPDLYAPTIDVISPNEIPYTTDDVNLVFTVDEDTLWMAYSLDGQDNVTITETTVNLTGLSEGTHNLIVYAKDAAENTGKSGTVWFSITQKTTPDTNQNSDTETDPPSIRAETITAVALTAVAGIAIMLYLMRKKG